MPTARPMATNSGDTCTAWMQDMSTLLTQDCAHPGEGPVSGRSEALAVDHSKSGGCHPGILSDVLLSVS